MSMQDVVKSTLAAAWPARRAPRIIYHHSVHPTIPGSLTPQRFAEQLDWLAQNNYSVVTLSEIAMRLKNDQVAGRVVAITFDDGYIDNYEYALPLLIERKMVATFFVVTSMIANSPSISSEGNCLYPDRQMLTKRQLQEMAAVGMEIASHTRTHVHVQRVYQLSQVAAWEELHGSLIELEDILSTPVRAFAYPNGQRGVFDDNTKAMLQRAGYMFGVTTMWGPPNRTTDLFAIPRMEIAANDTLVVFSKKIAGHYDFMRIYSSLVDRSLRWSC